MVNYDGIALVVLRSAERALARIIDVQTRDITRDAIATLTRRWCNALPYDIQKHLLRWDDYGELSTDVVLERIASLLKRARATIAALNGRASSANIWSNWPEDVTPTALDVMRTCIPPFEDAADYLLFATVEVTPQYDELATLGRVRGVGVWSAEKNEDDVIVWKLETLATPNKGKRL